MAGASGSEGLRPSFNDEELAWIGEHMSDLRRGVSERRFRNGMLWLGLALGLATYTAGYLLKSSVTGMPGGLLADLLYTLGWALWTGVVVAALVEIIPAAKERQIAQALDAYEAALRRKTAANPERTPATREG